MNMTFKLNEEQLETLERLSDFDDAYVLKGYAGTGKTTVITHWVKKIRERPKDAKSFWRAPTIVLTAPTNKATNVLKDTAKEINLPVDVQTIHSLLSLKLVWRKSEQVLEQDQYGDDNFGDYDYVIIDEASMLNEELMGYIRDAQDVHGNKVIFMGDPCQLPPINESESESFSASEDLSELTTVMRQGKGNPIQDFALYLRELILERPASYPSKIYTFIDDKHILHMPLAEFEEDILNAFMESDLDVRHVAWTNRVVDLWNNNIRDKIYGFDREEWTKGEMIVTTAPVINKEEKRIVFTTDTLLTIQREPKLVERECVPCWQLWCKNAIIYVPTSDAGKAFNERKAELLEAAKQNRSKWREFYGFMETFARVKPAHSLTVHRSQGSTFDDVYVSYQNILSNPRRKESLQCLYVAITRPRSRLILV
jgi:exodeoxyribonuclease-5